MPEEGVLIFGGYLSWEGRLQFSAIVVVGILSAAIGDNIGYWFGRHYGQAAIARYGHKLLITPERLKKARRFVARYGMLGVFIARFLPGLRFMAGPLAGSAAMPFLKFFIANLLGGLIYVPLSVFVGYLLGEGLGDSILRAIEHAFGKAEHFAILLLAIAAGGIVIWRLLSSRKVRRRYSES